VPEGDTIFRTAATLRARLTGRRIVRAAPPELERLAGSEVVDVESEGKHLFIHFSNGLALHSHMRMTGAWHVYDPGQRWRMPARLARAVLEVEGCTAVLFRAPVVGLVRSRSRDATGRLGPDLLGAQVDLDRIVSRARSLGPVPVGELLLDQRAAAGIGNIHRCELLWARRINPWRPAGALADGELRQLYAEASSGLRRGVRPGPHRHAVHGRGGRPCPRCGTLIQVRPQGELARLTYWCPSCQPD
jgi:endonuclease-8